MRSWCCVLSLVKLFVGPFCMIYDAFSNSCVVYCSDFEAKSAASYSNICCCSVKCPEIYHRITAFLAVVHKDSVSITVCCIVPFLNVTVALP